MCYVLCGWRGTVAPVLTLSYILEVLAKLVKVFGIYRMTPLTEKIFMSYYLKGEGLGIEAKSLYGGALFAGLGSI